MVATETLSSRTVGESLLETLRCRVETMRAGEQLPTERELADQHGVSYSTVRRVTAQLQEKGLVEKIHGKGVFVAERAPTEQRERTAIIYADPWRVDDNPFFIRCLQGILDEAHESGYRLEVFRCPHLSSDREEFRELCEEIARDGVRGLLLPWASEGLVDNLRAVSPQLRMVSMATRFPPENVASVVLDKAALGRRIAQYMLSKGVETVAAVVTQTESLLGLQGSDAVREGQIECIPLQTDPENSDHVKKVVDTIIKKNPQGIAFDDDRLAEKCLRELQDRKPDLYNQHRIISHANPGKDLFPPEVARLVMDSYEVGVGAIKLLRRMITENRSLGVTTLVRPTLEEPYVIERS